MHCIVPDSGLHLFPLHQMLPSISLVFQGIDIEWMAGEVCPWARVEKKVTLSEGERLRAVYGGDGGRTRDPAAVTFRNALQHVRSRARVLECERRAACTLYTL